MGEKDGRKDFKERIAGKDERKGLEEDMMGVKDARKGLQRQDRRKG